MSEFPAVGLRVDLSSVAAGRKELQGLKRDINAVHDASIKQGDGAAKGAAKTVKANNDVAKSDAARSRASEKAAAAETRAQKIAAAEQERVRRYLQDVRIRSIQWEQAASDAARRQETAAAAKAMTERLRQAKAVQVAQERAAQAAAAATDRASKQAETAARRAAATQMREAARTATVQAREAAKAAAAATKAAESAAAAQVRADNAATAQMEKNRTYLQRVRLTSIAWEEAARKKADAAAIADANRLAREAAKASRVSAGGGGGRSWGPALPVIGGGGGGGGPPDAASINRFSQALHVMRNGLRETRRLLFDVRTAVGVFLGGLLVKPLLDAADAMTALRARAGAFADAGSDVPELMERIYQTAQRTRTPLEAIATLYTRLAPLAKQLGKSQLDMLRITETVAKGIQIGGASRAEATSTSQQLAQALASNRFSGDELRSVAENAPILLQQISKALGMNTAQFIKWAHDGKATTAAVIMALEQAQGEIDRIFAAFPVTIGQSLTLVGNAFTNLVGRINDSTGASQAVAAMIARFAGFLDAEQTIAGLTAAVNVFIVAMRGLGVVIGVAVDYAPALAALFGVMAGTRILAAIASVDALRKGMLAYQLATALTGRATATWIGVQVGAAAAARGTMAALAGMTAALGGPFGIAIIAAVAAFSAFKANVLDLQKTMTTFGDAQQGASTAVERAITFMDTYGGSSENLIKIFDKLNGIQDEQLVGLDAAGQAAYRRAKNEQTLTESLLRRAAAEQLTAAATLRRGAAVAGLQALNAEIGAATSFLPTKGAREAKARFTADAAGFRQQQALQTSLAGQLTASAPDTIRAADAVRDMKIDLTSPGIRPPKPPGTPADPDKAAAAAAMRGVRMDDASAQAIARARLDELRAQLDLTKNVEKMAEMRTLEVRMETDAANTALLYDVAEKKISAAAAETAIAANNRALAYKEALIVRQASEEKENDALTLQERINGYLDQTTQAQLGLAASTEAIDALERESLARRQRAETARLAAELRHEVAAGEINQAEALQIAIAQQAAQAADRSVQAFNQGIRLREEANAAAEQELQGQIDILAASQALAISYGERRRIQEEMLRLDYQLQRLKISEAINDPRTSPAARSLLWQQLAVMDKAEQLRLAAINDAVNAYHDLTAGLQDMASAFEANDWEGVLKGLAGVINDVVKMLGKGGTFETKLGAALGLANGIGKMIGGSTGSAISGAASGAMGGMSLVASLAAAGTVIPGIGNVAGAVIGGVIGLAGAIFGSSKKKAEERAAAAQKKADEEAAKALQIATKTREFEIETIRAGQGERAAELETRKDELAALIALDPKLGEMQQKLWDMKDAADAASEALAKANAIIEERTQRQKDFNDLFLTDAQKMASAQKEVTDAFDKFGVIGVNTKEQFLNMLYAIDWSTESGLAMYDAMLKVAPTFALVADAAEKAGEAMIASAKAATDAIFEESRARMGLQGRLLRAQGNTAGATAIDRQLELEGTPAALRGLLTQVWAAEDALEAYNSALDKVQEAYDRERAVIEEKISAYDAVIKKLADFRKELDVGPMAANTAPQQYAKVSAILDATFAKAQAGDITAMGEIPDAVTAFLEASMEQAGTLNQYLEDVAKAKNIVDATTALAKTQKTMAEKQLDALNAQVSGILKVNESVLTVAEAIAALNAILAPKPSTMGAGSGSGLLNMLAGVGGGASAADGKATMATLTAAGIAVDGNNWSEYQGMIPGLNEQYSGLYSSANASATLADQYGGLGVQNASQVAGLAMEYINSHAPNAGGYDAAYNQDQMEYIRAHMNFAAGGAFTNGIVHSPTMFDIGQMGEAGSEGILPLARTGSGLGVHAVMGGDGETAELLREIIRDQRSIAQQTVPAIQKMGRVLAAWEEDGVGVRGATPGDPVPTLETIP